VSLSNQGTPAKTDPNGNRPTPNLTTSSPRIALARRCSRPTDILRFWRFGAAGMTQAPMVWPGQNVSMLSYRRKLELWLTFF